MNPFEGAQFAPVHARTRRFRLLSEARRLSRVAHYHMIDPSESDRVFAKECIRSAKTRLLEVRLARRALPRLP
jgi:hypothetical protein